jgi:hypothetical protein
MIAPVGGEKKSAPEVTPGPTGVSEHVSSPESGDGGDNNKVCADGGTNRYCGMCKPNSRKSCHRVEYPDSGDSTENTYRADAKWARRKLPA